MSVAYEIAIADTPTIAKGMPRESTSDHVLEGCFFADMASPSKHYEKKQYEYQKHDETTGDEQASQHSLCGLPSPERREVSNHVNNGNQQ
ncbi:hypothetical protein QBL02_03620 [Leucobacter sp. UT-8R-CII-1-4]|uniref:hypothetical protein n=1 Tax=Leucobacter sp. UT-8R-CII-1-4 TaxID=3040075 RepID=UPI0024A88B8C|nr:hypothetical protein [Leucobacter sp. UT-8R-CII-1-4]MDI6022628.1 hypothetical protein [Leucobacter sp. UT-8R-CII-1-4]